MPGFMQINLNFRSNNSNYWLGLRNSRSNHSVQMGWTWIDGAPFTNRLNIWGDNFPSGKYDCGSLISAENAAQLYGHWEDEHCEKPLRYICKKGATINN